MKRSIRRSKSTIKRIKRVVAQQIQHRAYYNTNRELRINNGHMQSM